MQKKIPTGHHLYLAVQLAGNWDAFCADSKQAYDDLMTDVYHGKYSDVKALHLTESEHQRL